MVRGRTSGLGKKTEVPVQDKEKRRTAVDASIILAYRKLERHPVRYQRALDYIEERKNKNK